jgi:hypothetical protein
MHELNWTAPHGLILTHHHSARKTFSYQSLRLDLKLVRLDLMRTRMLDNTPKGEAIAPDLTVEKCRILSHWYDKPDLGASELAISTRVAWLSLGEPIATNNRELLNPGIE